MTELHVGTRDPVTLHAGNLEIRVNDIPGSILIKDNTTKYRPEVRIHTRLSADYHQYAKDSKQERIEYTIQAFDQNTKTYSNLIHLGESGHWYQDDPEPNRV